jgi:RsiW-degrading membrane proteinase PrsW (M82 family)
MAGVQASSGWRSNRREAQVSRWAWLVVLIVGLALFIAVERTLIATKDLNYVPSVILLGAFLAPVTFVTYIYGRSPAWRVTLPILGLAALLGGVIGTVVAGMLEYDTLRQLGMLPTLAIGLIEESAKLIVPLAILIFTRSRTRADGLVVGVTVGAGFAALETMGYGFVTLLQSNGDVGAVQDTLLQRGLLSPAGHMAWSGLACTALFGAWSERGQGRALAGFVGTFIGVVVLHGLWDWVGSLWAYVVLGLISLLWLRHEVHRTLLETPPGQRWSIRS